MRLPGYRRRAPDPPGRGLMAPGPVAALPGQRRGLRCLLGRHEPDYYRLRAAGEKWAVFVFVCLRCNRVVGNSHASPTEYPSSRA